jgi:hypothetical protein
MRQACAAYHPITPAYFFPSESFGSLSASHHVNLVFTFTYIFREDCMKKNLGTVDRTIRILLAVIVGGLYLAGQITGTAGVLLALVAVILLLTGAVSFCPLYFALKFSTKKEGA